jgi:hypothetical protein
MAPEEKWFYNFFFDITSRSDLPFELGNISFDREKYRQQSHPIQLVRKT